MGASGNYPVFRQSALEMAEKLEKLGSPEARAKARVMREYEATFIDWEFKKPDSQERSQIISEFLTEVRVVMDYLAANPSGPS